MNMSKFDAWYQKFCSKIDPKDIPAAVNKAYASSVVRALYDDKGKLIGFGGKTTEKINARKKATDIIVSYLSYVEQYKSFPYSIRRLWDQIRNVYHECDITWYTYGNAQKWVAMSIKYHLFLKHRDNPVDLPKDILANIVFPVDGIMIQEIASNKNGRLRNSVNFDKKPWSQCNDKQIFIQYLSDVKATLPTGTKLLEFEIDTWQTKKATKNNQSYTP